jgi:uracil-DNA glycosylase family 4
MDAYAALKLQIEWGADEALDDAPIDRLRPAPSRPVAVPERPSPPPAQATPTSPRGAPAERATQAAAAATTLDALRDAIAAFDGSPLRDTATNLVFAGGAATSGLLFVGEAPNADADRSGDPFAGPTGSYLELMLRSIGLDRDNMALTPLIPWRPPGDRPPSPNEIATCLPFLHRLIILMAPRRIVALGPLPARTLLGVATLRQQGVPAWRATAIPGLHESIATLLMPSPAILLRSPQQRRIAWAALRFLRLHAIPT